MYGLTQSVTVGRMLNPMLIQFLFNQLPTNINK